MHALEDFSPTPEMPGDHRGASAARCSGGDRRGQGRGRFSQTARTPADLYGKALIGVHGYGAPETALAFERARELATGLQAAGLDDSIDRFSATYGVWVGTHVRGEFFSMRELAATFLRESASRPNSGEASVAHRIMGATHWFAAESVEARAHLEQAVAIFDPSRDAVRLPLRARYRRICIGLFRHRPLATWRNRPFPGARTMQSHAPFAPAARRCYSSLMGLPCPPFTACSFETLKAHNP